MTRPQDQAAPSPSSVAHRFGAASGDAVPRTEHVRVTAPDLERRAAMERTRGRLVLVAIGFGVLTCETGEQAWARASVDRKNKGSEVAHAALRMIELKRELGHA